MNDSSKVLAEMARADELMRAGDFSRAQRAYMAAWPLSRDTLEPGARVWLLLSIAHASLRASDPTEAFNACAGAQNGFARSTGLVAGNPMFHLLAGLAATATDEPAIAEDNLTRALICGGPAMFADEDPRHLAALKQKLLPPAELGTWDDYEGCSRHKLNQASGYLAELITERLGSSPPYRPPLSPSDFEGACTDPIDRPAPWGNGRVYYVMQGERDVIRFYADIDTPVRDVRIDYEILDESLSDGDARELIVHSYFVRFTRDHYRGQIESFELGRLGGDKRQRVPYPAPPPSNDW
ncbi:MAG: hypothetical protein QM756_03115 [Polyangiaceae bacterium]